MLFNPYSEQGRGLLQVVPGTRVLQHQLGLPNAVVEDPMEAGRMWRAHAVYSPIPGRAIGGVRVKLIDCKGFTTFCNQRDLELLLGLAKPGDWCPWMGTEYPGINDECEGWFGLCMDHPDVVDDLYETELLLRAQHLGGVLDPRTISGVTRRLHLDPKRDVERVDVFLWDADPETGLGPDARLETVERRWRQSEQRSVLWTRL